MQFGKFVYNKFIIHNIDYNILLNG